MAKVVQLRRSHAEISVLNDVASRKIPSSVVTDPVWKFAMFPLKLVAPLNMLLISVAEEVSNGRSPLKEVAPARKNEKSTTFGV